MKRFAPWMYFGAVLLTAGVAKQVEVVWEEMPFHAAHPSAPQLDAPAPAPTALSPEDVDRVVKQAALKNNVDEAFIRSIIAAESSFRGNALSNKGAQGYMQVMPSTAAEMGYDSSVPEQNIQAGTQYLSRLMDHYKGRKDQLTRVVAAYNAGPGAVDKYNGVPPYTETQNYVKRVFGFFKKFGGEVEEPVLAVAKPVKRFMSKQVRMAKSLVRGRHGKVSA